VRDALDQEDVLFAHEPELDRQVDGALAHEVRDGAAAQVGLERLLVAVEPVVEVLVDVEPELALRIGLAEELLVARGDEPFLALRVVLDAEAQAVRLRAPPRCASRS
jgi:hypothetical protein